MVSTDVDEEESPLRAGGAWPGNPGNGIRDEQLGHEGEDTFIQDDRYFDAYARYFRRYVEARRLTLASYFGYDNLLAFRNPDGELVLILQNERSEPMRLRIMVGGRLMIMTLPADSFNTVTLPKAQG